MDEVWPRIVHEYARTELLPAYVCAVAVWIISTPFRRIAGAFLLQVWRVLRLNGGMWFEIASRYQEELQNREFRQLRGPAYAYALWSALFTVPVQVLRDGEVEYGRYGRMHRSWWLAGQVTLGEYGPELLVRTVRSLGRYGRASGEACLLTGRRMFAVMHGVGWLLLLLLSLAIHIQMALYDLMEFSLCGTVGVVALVAALNALNYLLKWTAFGLETTVTIGQCWDSVLQHADDRDRSESASLLRLQEPDVEELEDFQAALDDPNPDEWAPRFGEASTDRTVPADFTHADVELANTLTDLAAQASAITKMAAQAQLRVRRGRQTSGRGDCPVPWNVGGIPGGSSQGLAGDEPPPRPPGVNPSRRVGTAADGYTTSTARSVPSATSRRTAPRG
ncbi:hypothetical protein PR001_g19661 [Phytophthora rubi]|uniref:Uncharacterized protein n=1 Tax=Phytophthora rubi TaxID=129364 RepID=A0A6A3JQK3_9STRA|nr:hypothetical protein PR001_g19661 [Phytophthora rubi]KAE9003005.1 hypothetical protein PR002_g17468 [Phytophthora rubi]